MKNNVLIVIIALVVLGCSTTSKTVDNQIDNRELKEMVAQKAFEVIVDHAFPQSSTTLNSISQSGLLGPGNSAGRINMMGDGSYLRMQGDSVAAYLPYFGERRSGGGYGASSAIEFKGLAKELTITHDAKNKSYRLKFNIRKASELYDVDVLLYANLSSRINVTSSERTFIRYEGTVSGLKDVVAQL